MLPQWQSRFKPTRLFFAQPLLFEILRFFLISPNYKTCFLCLCQIRLFIRPHYRNFQKFNAEPACLLNPSRGTTVSVGPEPQLTVQQAEQARQIKRLVEEIIRLSEQDLPPEDYYREYLKRVLSALEAPAGAVWIRNPQGHFPLQYHINVQQVGLDRSEEGRRSHDELIRQAAFKAQPMVVPPRSGAGPGDNDLPAPGNPTDYVILIVPILVDKQVAGLVEVWQDPRLNPNALRNQTQFLIQVSALATVYTRNHRLRQMVGQEKLWTQLEAFTRQIHGTLNPTEVSYLVANEARRLVECDRISVGVRHGKKAKVEAISGADTVEKRSNLVQLMRTLFQRVLVWGEKLIYTGLKDDTLPPDVLDALDAYLAESNSKRAGTIGVPAGSRRPARHQRSLQFRRAPPHPHALYLDADRQGARRLGRQSPGYHL